MKNFRIALLPGDGIGTEVIDVTVKVLDAVSRIAGFPVTYETHSVGATEYLENGVALPESVLEKCAECDAILLGAMGLPDVRLPSGVELTPQIEIREKLDLYNGLRPIKLYHESDTPLKGYGKGDIDIMLVRENTEGLFYERSKVLDLEADSATDLMYISRKGAERICRAAFQQARKRRKFVTLVDKANVLPSMAYLRNIFNKIAEEYPDVKTERQYIDAMALFLVQRPNDFDVVVTENMFGDILSDLLAGIVGGMGMAPSADIGDNYAVFQPSHGTAPSIAGLNIANPIATILSAAMMLQWLDTEETQAGADLIYGAVEIVFSNPENRTCDMGGSLTTTLMAALVIEAINTLADN
ncbi:MAG: isocitrate/isopropylmalate dehydrogenase family protein [Verrucomicrobia bacterium]|nr:isocitrate/isopropylmalate dehydrogenase family protein [Verrucomicrobiota bacterium]MDA1066936.1 isocitrate/isopropylmalate dehydrogenase family protein [Verrucomicrobiota bacterium]